MKKTYAVMAAFVLCACVNEPPASQVIADSAIMSVTALEKQLPEQCSTDGIKAQISAIKTQISAITNAATTEKAQINAEKLRWQWAFFALLAAVAAYAVRKILK